MIQFLLGLFVGRFIRLDDSPSLIEKWQTILNYSSSYQGIPRVIPIPSQDRLMVATLMEQAEHYCQRHPEENCSDLITTIRTNYKNMSFDFSH